MRLEISSPNYTTLMKRLKELKFKCPRYTKHSKIDSNIAAIALGSTGLKQFGRDKRHVEKHKVSATRS